MFKDGNWGAWSSFGACSATCGGGTQTHTRICNNPSPANGGATCVGSTSESTACNTQACPTGMSIINYNNYTYLLKLWSLICICVYLQNN